MAIVVGVSFLYLPSPPAIAGGEVLIDLSTTLMRSTFKIEGSKSLGAAFIVGKPRPDIPGRAFYVLVTDAHVLRDIDEDEATLWLRQKEGDGYKKLEWKIPIRHLEKPLWTEHPEADVAVMYVRLPTTADIDFLPMAVLASDKELEEFEIHPGDRLFSLGFPIGAAANEAGFPILRNDNIASFPLLPTLTTKTFLLDFAVFGGNSGGPVYFEDVNRKYRSGIKLGQVLHLINGFGK